MKSENHEMSGLLNNLADATKEKINPALAEEIKAGIPQNLRAHKSGFDTISIMIDLRINKLTAAAAIIITILLCANLLSINKTSSDSIYQDSRLLVDYLAGRHTKKNILEQASNFYQYLINQGKEAVYYGDIVEPGDANAILVHLKLSDGSYMVRFADLHTDTVSAEELVKLQAKMLEKKSK